MRDGDGCCRREGLMEKNVRHRGEQAFSLKELSFPSDEKRRSCLASLKFFSPLWNGNKMP